MTQIHSLIQTMRDRGYGEDVLAYDPAEHRLTYSSRNNNMGTERSGAQLDQILTMRQADLVGQLSAFIDMPKQEIPDGPSADLSDLARAGAQAGLLDMEADRAYQRLVANHHARQRFLAEQQITEGRDRALLAPGGLRAFKPSSWLVKGLVPESSFGFIYGDSMAKKSFVAIDLAECVATGHDFHGRPVKQGKVLYLIGEGAGGFQKRLDGWVRENGVEDAVWTLPFIPALVGGPEFDWLLEEVSKGFDLIVVDTLAIGAVGLDLTRAEDATIATEAMKRLQRASGGTVVALHHTGHAEKNRMSQSYQLIANADFILKVEHKDGDLRNPVKISSDKLKEHDHSIANTSLSVAEVVLGEDAEGDPIKTLVLRDEVASVARPDVWSPKRSHEVVYAHLAARTGREQAVNVSEVMDALKEAGQPHGRTTAQRALTDLINQGLVAEVDGNRKPFGWDNEKKVAQTVYYDVTDKSWPTDSTQHPDPNVRIETFFGGAA